MPWNGLVPWRGQILHRVFANKIEEKTRLCGVWVKCSVITSIIRNELLKTELALCIPTFEQHFSNDVAKVWHKYPHEANRCSGIHRTIGCDCLNINLLIPASFSDFLVFGRLLYQSAILKAEYVCIGNSACWQSWFYLRNQRGLGKIYRLSVSIINFEHMTCCHEF